MEKTTRIAFDLGGVMIERGALENYLIEESIVSVKLTVEKFDNENVFIISKAKEKYIARNIELLQKHDFFNKTGFKKQNIFFVNQYEEKGPLGVKLGINYLIDDSIKVAKTVLQSGFKPILFGEHEEFLKQNKEIINAKNWKAFRKILEKIKR